jgi:3-phosphoshikimate 1-carboxyvinyltransferase
MSASELKGASIGGALIPRLIDEIPVLAIAAARARGVTTVGDAAELRVKESDRIVALARELGKMGVVVRERPDGMTIEGPQRFQGARVASGGDHRVAMALVVAGLVADGDTIVEDTACVATSFPQFAAMMNALAGTDAVTVENA